MALNIFRSAANTAATLTVCAATLVYGAAAAHADPDPAAPPVPAEYKAAVAEAGKVCQQIDPPFVAALLSVASNFDAKAKSAAGAISAGQLMPKTWEQFSSPEDSPTDPASSARVTAKYMCSVADRIDKKNPPAASRPTFYLIEMIAGPAMADKIIDKTITATEAQALPEVTTVASKILKLRDEYKKQGV